MNSPKISFGTVISDREEGQERYGINKCRNHAEEPSLLERTGR